MIAALTMENYGYSLVGNPPRNCGPFNSDVVFYSMVLITNIISVIGIPMLIIVAWSLHKVGLYDDQCIILVKTQMEVLYMK